VVAYGALLPQSALAVPQHGWVNLHFSILPAWRGAAPVQHALMHGDDVTGATTFRIVRELDAGPVFGVLTESIRPSDTAGELLDRLAAAGADLMVATLDGIESGELQAREQPPSGVTLAPKITPSDARIDWHTPAMAIDRLVRACTPEPGAWTELDGVRLKLWPVAMTGADAASPDAGEVQVLRDRILVGTATVPVVLGDVQPHGKRRMSAADWARGARLGAHTVLG
jgi:methionyl-tRNA formyltransferase